MHKWQEILSTDKTHPALHEGVFLIETKDVEYSHKYRRFKLYLTKLAKEYPDVFGEFRFKKNKLGDIPGTLKLKSNKTGQIMVFDLFVKSDFTEQFFTLRSTNAHKLGLHGQFELMIIDDRT